MVIRAYSPADRERVFDLLGELPHFYPDALAWLSRRLLDVSGGRASCTVVEARGRLAAVAIETPKKPSLLKLSTFYVHGEFREQGIGTALIKHLISGWVRDGVAHAYITMDSTLEGLRRFFARFGFREILSQPHRYRHGSVEVVLVWSSQLASNGIHDGEIRHRIVNVGA
jgi:GNAT superfamily N-acetyltransferase